MVTKLILALLTIGLAVTGELSPVTRKIVRLAIESQQNEIVSLHKWNHALTQRSHKLNSTNPERPDFIIERAM